MFIWQGIVRVRSKNQHYNLFKWKTHEKHRKVSKEDAVFPPFLAFFRAVMLVN
jgi:hypothetical protein